MGSARVQKETEAGREQVLRDIEYKLIGLRRARDLEELESRIRVATHELEWKQLEATYLKDAESDRVEREQITSSARLDLRRADSIGNLQKRGRSRRNKL